MALSIEGWIDGLTASGIVISGVLFGIFVIYKAKKTNAKLLFYVGLVNISGSLGWLGNLVDFLTILSTGSNMDNSYGLYIILSKVWLPINLLCAMYVSAELLIPEKKWYVVAIYSVLGVIFEIFLFLDVMNSFTFIYPSKSGEDLIDESIVFTSPVGIILIIFQLSALIFWGFGFLIKSIQSEGIIRKKFLFLSIGSFLFIVCGSLDSTLPPSIILVFARSGILISFWVIYLGLREEPEKKEKIKPKKEVRVEGDLFRISKYKKEDITEEEVSISKEKKICLVCKGRVRRCYVYICECDTFYCEKCASALENLENECWVCGIKFNESKPSKPYKRDEEEVDIEISGKPQKKPITKK